MAADRIVYSTDPNWKPPCKRCGESPCVCAERRAGASAGSPGAPLRRGEPVRISFRRGHKGSGITLIERLPFGAAHREEYLKTLKRALGVGGTLRGDTIELQGDQRDLIEKKLQADGYKVRRIGG